jgi:WD40 repeat protein
LWDLKTYNALGSNYTSFESECYGLQFSDSGNFISAYCENTIRVWTDDYFKEVKEIKGLSGHIKDAVYSHDGAFIATANEG